MAIGDGEAALVPVWTAAGTHGESGSYDYY